MKYFFTLLISLFALNIFAEGMHIKGVIADMDSKMPIKEANVSIRFFAGFEFSDLTDSLGQYEITTTAIVPDGYYGIEVEANGYFKLNGFVHVTKNCSFNFSLKQKNPNPLTPIIYQDTTQQKPVKFSPLEGYATNNLVFLIDVSSSMNQPDRMPLLKESMKYLVNELRPTDRVAILTFSSYTKEVLSSTPVLQKELIFNTIDRLTYGSTTNGGTALDMAYKAASKSFIQKGNNRIVLASDGMFTSGEKEYKKMQQTIESGKEKGISLSIFCFGKNTDYVKSKLEKLTHAGSGNYANITTIDESKLHMLEEAKAVKNN